MKPPFIVTSLPLNFILFKIYAAFTYCANFLFPERACNKCFPIVKSFTQCNTNLFRRNICNIWLFLDLLWVFCDHEVIFI